MCIYIVTEFGLCNRLSWFCGLYIYNNLEKCAYNNKECIVYLRWDPTSSCNGRYEDLFDDLPRMKRVRKDEEVPKNIRRYKGQNSVPNIFKTFNIDITSYEECLTFALLKFKDDIEMIAKEFKDKFFSEKTIGLHIRRTDHVYLAKNRGNFTDDNFFFRIIEKEIKENTETKFYLSTDNVKTQDIFLNKFPNNILIRNKIIKNNEYYWRNTSLKDAGIDLCLLSHCHHVEGSFHSSFSRVAVMLNLNRRNEREKAEKELNEYVFRGYKYN